MLAAVGVIIPILFCLDYLFLLVECGMSLITHCWLVAWENMSEHFVMPPLVSPQNDIWGKGAEIPYWWLITKIHLSSEFQYWWCITNQIWGDTVVQKFHTWWLITNQILGKYNLAQNFNTDDQCITNQIWGNTVAQIFHTDEASLPRPE